ncbi:Flp pilus assembly protein CpaB [Nesterenkonia populi]
MTAPAWQHPARQHPSARRRQRSSAGSVPFVPERPRASAARRSAPRPLPAPAAAESERPRAAKQRPASRPFAARRPPRVRRRMQGAGLGRAVRRFRIPLALLMGAAALAAVLLGQESTDFPSRTAVRVTAEVPAGQALSASQLEEAEVDAGSLPEDYAHSAEDFVGQILAAPLPAGAVVHPAQLVGPGLLKGHEPGTVAVPVRPADTAMLGLLSVGQRVDVLASTDAAESESGTARVAESAPVLWMPQGAEENWVGGTADGQDVAILAVDAETAERLAEAGSQGRLHLSLTSGPAQTGVEGND